MTNEKTLQEIKKTNTYRCKFAGLMLKAKFVRMIFLILKLGPRYSSASENKSRF